MNKQEIKSRLVNNHQAFAQFLLELSESEFVSSKNGKWTPGQQLEHIHLGVKPFRQILFLPKFLLKLIWGTANRQSKSYDDLVKKYLHKLEKGGRATGRFIPKFVQFGTRQKLIDNLTNEVRRLCDQLDKYTETELDQLILPHPLLGKLTMREMLYFTIYHVQHHEELIQTNLYLK